MQVFESELDKRFLKSVIGDGREAFLAQLVILPNEFALGSFFQNKLAMRWNSACGQRPIPLEPVAPKGQLA